MILDDLQFIKTTVSLQGYETLETLELLPRDCCFPFLRVQRSLVGGSSERTPTCYSAQWWLIAEFVLVDN